ncbi:MAG: ABC transporter permease [Candidatus Heimdallarchaeota archaeon]|nr:ABC transporter permease [Candidatus Heimdallarchaeota archaeon]
MGLLSRNEIVSWSGVFHSGQCKTCGKTKTIQFVQTQEKVKLGPIKLINLGSRGFSKECSNCKSVYELKKTESSTARREKYSIRSISPKTDVEVEPLRYKKYPALKTKTRKEIRAENIKEGITSAAIGGVIGLIVLLFVWWGVIIILLSLLGGLYAGLEDPELKHHAQYEKTGHVYTKENSKRQLN